MRSYYPVLQPYNTFELTVDDIHTLTVEECGNPKGLPAVVLHGGPGTGCSTDDRRLFDPDIYRIVLFDQRGCGRSKPLGSIERNTTQYLLDDIEFIRTHLNIKRWLVVGGSWGSSLALAYGQTHPDAVLGFILRGVFLFREQDIEWLYQRGANQVFPDAWQEFIQTVPQSEQKNMIKAIHTRVTSNSEFECLRSAKAWATFEAACATLQPNEQWVKSLASPQLCIPFARIATHYFLNKGFFETNQLLDNLPQLKDKPCIIIHGRYDMVCPLDNAWSLKQAWPIAELDIIRDAGHAGIEAGIVNALVRATRQMANELLKQIKS